MFKACGNPGIKWDGRMIWRSRGAFLACVRSQVQSLTTASLSINCPSLYISKTSPHLCIPRRGCDRANKSSGTVAFVVAFHMCFIFALKIYAGKLCFRLRRRIMQRKHMLGMKKNALLLMKNVRWSNLRRLHSLLRKTQLSHGSHSTWGHQAAVIQWLGEGLKSTAEFNKSSNLNLSVRKDDSKLIYLCSVLKSTFQHTDVTRYTGVIVEHLIN